MSAFLSYLAERQILKAQEEGQLQGLAGEGRPLPLPQGDAHIGAADAVGHRLMAEAGVVPEQVRLRRALAEARTALGAAEGDVAKRAALARLADLELRYGMAMEKRRAFLR